MPNLKKAIFSLGISITLLFLTSSDVEASREFEINSTSTYKVSLDRKTSVVHEIKLTNKFPHIYATEYALSIGSTRVSNVWAKDVIGFLDTKIQTTSNSTTISFSFKEKSVGLGQTLSFSIGYEDKDVAQKNGRIWEVNIPRPEDINEFDSYDVILIVPKEFNEPVQITPQYEMQSQQEGQIVLSFVKDKLLSRGITAIFGDKQVFSFDLRYSLENPGPVKKLIQIALPPDTPYQKMLYDRISPPPLKIELDNDGNWLASYQVNGGEISEIHATGYAILYLEPKISTNYGRLPPDSYLNQGLPWQVDDPTIQELSNKLKTPENIYNYIVETLSYNYDRIQVGSTRLGAQGALAYPDQAICMEFTDLFIALTRAAGIPARELNGFAYTQNPQLRPLGLRQDILHAWPEYYDKESQRWIQVDPTWGDTTQGIDYFSRFDLNHIVFVIHGSNSQTPFPAGFYKISETEGKDIIITPSESDPQSNQIFDVSLNLPEKITAGFLQTGTITITNSGNVASYNQQIEILTNGFDILTPTKIDFDSLLPYTSYEVPIKLKAKNLFEEKESAIKISLNDKIYETKIIIKPIYQKIPQLALSLALGFGLATTATRARRLLLSLKKGRGDLRRESQQS
jgi:hypothetical protein